MSYKRLGDQGNILVFSCDHPKCEIVEEVYKEDGQWIVQDPFGSEIKLEKDTPVIIPWNWRTDGMNHFCWRHRITYEPAIIAESVREATPEEIEKMKRLLASDKN